MLYQLQSVNERCGVFPCEACKLFALFWHVSVPELQVQQLIIGSGMTNYRLENDINT